MNIAGYEIYTEWTEAGNGDWAFAKKDDVDYFIKRFPRPKYPMPGKQGPAAERHMKEACDVWTKRQGKLISALRDICREDGSLVIPVGNVFRQDSTYYKVTLKINTDSLKISEISGLSHSEKIRLMKSFAFALNTMHSKGIIHGDIKPDNVLITKSGVGGYTARLIDFDDSYFEGDPPMPEETVGTPEYYSPELGAFIVDGSGKTKAALTCKSDVFSAGLLFHQYYTGKDATSGEKPAYRLKSASEFRIDTTIPPGLKKMITEMLDLEPKNRPSMGDVINRLSKFSDIGKASEEEIEKIEKLKNNQYKIYYSSGRTTIAPESVIKGVMSIDISKFKVDEKVVDEKMPSKNKKIISVTDVGNGKCKIEYSDGSSVVVLKKIYESMDK